MKSLAGAGSFVLAPPTSVATPPIAKVKTESKAVVKSIKVEEKAIKECVDEDDIPLVCVRERQKE